MLGARETHGVQGSGFLSVSDSDRSVPAELGQESQASSSLRKGGVTKTGTQMSHCEHAHHN